MINTRQTKVKLILLCMMEKVDLKSGEVIAKEAVFLFKTEGNLESTNSNELLSKMKETVLESLAKFQRQGSNWRFNSVLSLDLHTVKYEPRGGSYYIPLPKFLTAKKAIINLRNEDDECFKWVITRALNPVEKNSERIDRKLRETSKTLNWEGLKFPVNFSDINIFENHNSSISVNVSGYKKLIYTLRISKHNYQQESTVNLLLISDDAKQHYGWIKGISKLLSLQTSKHGHVRHVCFRCLNTFNFEKSLAYHHEYCKSHEAINIEHLENGSKISFKNHNRSMRVPFIVYADFELSHQSCQHATTKPCQQIHQAVSQTHP